MPLEFAAIAKAYGVTELIDYERGSGLLLASGSGTMMAVMDLCPQLRWCLDIDVNRQARLGGLLAWASRFCSPICIAGWFSITAPAGLQGAIAEATDETSGEFSAVIYAAPDVTLSARQVHVASLEELQRVLEGDSMQSQLPGVHHGVGEQYRVGENPVVGARICPA